MLKPAHVRIITAAAIVFALSVAAFGARATEIDFSKVLVDLEGLPFSDCRKVDVTKVPPFCEKLVDLTLGGLSTQALNSPEQNLTPEQQTVRGMLAIRLNAGGTIDVTADEIKLIKDLIMKRSLPPVAVVRAMEVLDPASLKRPGN